MAPSNESDSDDSVIIVPYVKPKPPEIVLDDSDGEDQPQRDTRRVSTRIREELACQGASTPVKSVPAVIQEPSETMAAGPSDAAAAKPSTSKQKRATSKTNSIITETRRKNASDGDSGTKKTPAPVKKTKSKSPAKSIATANSSESVDVAASSGKKKRKGKTETTGAVLDSSVENVPSSKVKQKRRKKDSQTIDPSQAAAVDHFRFMQQLNLFPGDAPEPKVKKSRKKGASSSSVISPEEIEALNAQISYDLQNNPIRIRPLESMADDSSLASFDSATPVSTLAALTTDNVVAGSSTGFVSVTEETTGKLRKKRPKVSVPSDASVLNDKFSPSSEDVGVMVPTNENLENPIGLSMAEKRKVKTKAKEKLRKEEKKQQYKIRKERQKNRSAEKGTDLPGSNDVIWTASEEEDDVITTAELQAVQSSITLNVGDGRSRLTVDQMREHAMRKSKPDPHKPRIFDPSLETHGTKRSASPSGLPPAKARTVGTSRARFREVVQVPPEIDIPWDVSKEGRIEDRSFPKTWNRRMMEFYGGITKDSIDLEGVWRIQDTSTHLWKIREDLERSGMRSRKKCLNCKLYGDHFTRDCPRDKRNSSCFMCGDPGGAHYTGQFYRSNSPAAAISSRCPKSSCLNCGQKLPGKFVQRCGKCGPLFRSQGQKCSTCKLQGHRRSACPDNWRRFHTITNEAQLLDPELTKSAKEVKYKKQRHSYCPNCGQKGHSYFECGSRCQLNQWYSPAHPMIHGEPSLEGLDGTLHPAAHIMPQRTFRQPASTSAELVQLKASLPSRSSTVVEKKKKCDYVPDCKNFDSTYCYKIFVTHKIHRKLVQIDDEMKFVEKINRSYDSKAVMVSLLRKRAEIHVGGTQNFRLRKRMSDFVAKLKQEPEATVHDLLPELYPPPPSPARTSDCSPEILEILDPLEGQASAVPVVTIDDEDDDVVALPPHETETSSKVFKQPKSSSESQTPIVKNLAAKHSGDIGSFSCGFVNIEAEKRNADPSKNIKSSSNIEVEKRVTRSSKQIQSTAEAVSDKLHAVVTNDVEPLKDRHHSYPLGSETLPSPAVTNNLGAELYLLNKKASNIVGRISAQSRTARRSVDERVQPSSTTSPREEDSFVPVRSSSGAPESFERHSESVSSSTDLPRPSGAAIRQSSSSPSAETSRRPKSVSAATSQIQTRPEALYDRRRRPPRQLIQQPQPEREFESIRYGDDNPINFRDIDERSTLHTGNVWTSAIHDSQNRPRLPPPVFNVPHTAHVGTPQVPMNAPPPLIQNYRTEGSNYGPYPYDQNPYMNPFFQQPHTQQIMGGWQNMQPIDNHPFVQDSYANMVVQQQQDFYVPPPQQFHPTGPGSCQIHSNPPGNYRFNGDQHRYKNEFRRGRGRGRGGYERRPRGANRWERPTR